jgi:hypothetical protein
MFLIKLECKSSKKYLITNACLSKFIHFFLTDLKLIFPNLLVTMLQILLKQSYCDAYDYCFTYY